MKSFISLGIMSLSIFLLFYGEGTRGASSKPYRNLQKETFVLGEKRASSFREHGFHEKLGKDPVFEKEKIFWKEFKEKSELYFYEKKKAFSKETQKEILVSVLEDEEKFTFFTNVLLDLEGLYREKPMQQAYMRIFALSLVVEKARLGELHVLEDFVIKLLFKREENRKIPGSEEDILELIISWAEFFGKEKVLNEPSIFFDAFSYKVAHRGLFSKALSYLYPKLFWDNPKFMQFSRFLDGGG